MSLARAARFRRLTPSRGDLLLTAALAVPVVGSLVARANRDDQPLVVLLALAALSAVAMRRARPIDALVLAVAALSAMSDNRALLFPVMVVLYTIASLRPWQTAAAAGAGAALVVTIAGAASSNSEVTGHGGLLGYAIGVIASCAAAIAFGLYVGARRRVLDGLRDRAERLERERRLLADRAVGEERIRIAQELHDVVAHNVSLMVVQAQALGATMHDDRVTHGTDAIADLGRQAMAEMHRTLRLLRSDDSGTPELTPQPGLAQLGPLLEQSRAAGLEIELTVEGLPRPLSQGIDLSAFRIIQEALTNVVKHAAGARTKVTLSYGAEALRLTIIDDGDEARTTTLPPAGSDGHGLIGMRERATLFGGTLTTQARPAGGFKVAAMLPYLPTAS